MSGIVTNLGSVLVSKAIHVDMLYISIEGFRHRISWFYISDFSIYQWFGWWSNNNVDIKFSAHEVLWFYCSQTLVNYLTLTFQCFDIDCIWLRLFQERIVCTEFNIYVVITSSSKSLVNTKVDTLISSMHRMFLGYHGHLYSQRKHVYKKIQIMTCKQRPPITRNCCKLLFK
jgi:hypothetical protein